MTVAALVSLLLLAPQEAAQTQDVRWRLSADASSAPAAPSVADIAPVPAWALGDAARWEADQCGAEPGEACLRQARNRLALARAAQVERAQQETTRPSPAARLAAGASRESVAGAPRCHWRRAAAESGTGGSVSYICGDSDGAAARTLEDFLNRTD